MFRRLFAWMGRNERHLSALAMLAGFTVDNLFFGRIDLPTTQAIFIVYLVLAAASIALLHSIEARAAEGLGRPRIRPLLPLLTQFALGGLWSGYLIFYARSASLGASWPYLTLLVGIFLGNEAFKKYHDRLIFTAVLFFFALYSYAIFALPIVTGSIGTATFLASGALAIACFALFIALVRILGRRRFLEGAWPIRLGVAVVAVVINLAYFANVLPPLPLSLKAGAVYHAVSHDVLGYHAMAEREPWYVALGALSRSRGARESLHVVAGESLYAYSAVFAPIALSTTIVHHWERYDPAKRAWVTEAAIALPILGGRDGGYRGYSAKANPAAGDWRVDITTIDGRVIGRLEFRVLFAALPPPETSLLLE